MAVVLLYTGKTSILAKAIVGTYKVPKQIASLPGGLYPIRMSYWNTDEYRIANGWPVSVPDYDIKARSLVSCEGVVLTDRDTPRGTATNATVRWIADDEMYDVTDLQWYPLSGEPLVWVTSPDYAPTFITDYEYRHGKEQFYENAINFDSDNLEHMWCNLNEVLGGSAGYSVLFCVSMNSVFGNDDSVPYSGIWCPGMATPALGEAISETPEGGFVSLTLQGGSLYLETDQSDRVEVLKIANLVASTTPFLVGMVIKRPYATIYAGKGPSSLTSAKVNIGRNTVSLDGNIVLGRTRGGINRTADMALLDLGLYADQLTTHEVKEEFSVLASIYGGDK